MNPKAAPNQLRRAFIRIPPWVARAEWNARAIDGYLFSLCGMPDSNPLLMMKFEQRLCQHDCITTQAAKPRADG
jgi:hypothetical protein